MLAGVASAAGRAAIHAVRVQIVPAPRSLVDSREILRILQSYGEVTTYRWLKHDALSMAQNSAMAIFADGDSMHRFLQECPLTFEIDRTEREEEAFEDLPVEDEADEHALAATYTPINGDSGGGGGTDELTRTSNALLSSSSKPSTPIRRKPEAKKPNYLTRPQLFRVNADVWRGKHRDWLERHPFWGNFQPRKTSLVAQDLAKRVPLAGLVDIDAKGMKEIPIRILNRRKEMVGKRMSVREMIGELRGKEGVEGETSSGHWG